MRKLHCLPVSIPLLVGGRSTSPITLTSEEVADVTGILVSTVAFRVKSNRSTTGMSVHDQGAFSIYLRRNIEPISVSNQRGNKKIAPGSYYSKTIALNIPLNRTAITNLCIVSPQKQACISVTRFAPAGPFNIAIACACEAIASRITMHYKNCVTQC